MKRMLLCLVMLYSALLLYAVDTSPFYVALKSDFVSYIDNRKGFNFDNAYIDLNNDGVAQDGELLPLSVFAGTMEEQNSSTAKYVTSSISSLAQEKKAILAECIAKIGTIKISDSLGAVDYLGSLLSISGFHPFSKMDIYYFPINKCGTKVKAEDIKFYKNNSPSYIEIDVDGWSDPSLEIIVPNSEKRAWIWLYNSERVKTIKDNLANAEFWKTWDKSYWMDINKIRFQENGGLASIDAIPYSELPLDPSLGCASPLVHVHTIKWNPWNQIYAMYPGEEMVFNFKGNITVIGPRWINWWVNVDFREVYVSFGNGFRLNYLFKKGDHQFVKQIANTGNPFSDWEKYTRKFDQDTKVTISGGIFIAQDGSISMYW